MPILRVIIDESGVFFFPFLASLPSSILCVHGRATLYAVGYRFGAQPASAWNSGEHELHCQASTILLFSLIDNCDLETKHCQSMLKLQ